MIFRADYFSSFFIKKRRYAVNSELIKKINKNIVHENGTIDSFDKQLIQLMSGVFDTKFPLVISDTSNALSYIADFKAENPLIINSSTVIKLREKHDLGYEFVSECEKYLRESVLAFDSIQHNTSKVILLQELDDDGFPMIAICREDKTIGEGLYINEVTSIYEKKNLESLIIRTYQEDKVFYKNEKTEQYIQSIGLQLPQGVIYALSKNYDKQSFTKSQVEHDIKKLEVSYTDAFFINHDSKTVDWIYYNTDSNAGGQYVTNTLDYELIDEAYRDWKIPEEFFDFLNSTSSQICSDIDSENFSFIERRFLGKEDDVTFTGDMNQMDIQMSKLIDNTIFAEQNEVSRIWKVYGVWGYEQKESTFPSYSCDFTKGPYSDGNMRKIDVYNSDKTGTNDYTVVKITRHTAEACLRELHGQVNDGIFENSQTGKIVEISEEELSMIFAETNLQRKIESEKEDDFEI